MDNLSSESNNIKEKINVSEAEIVVHGTADKPYYEIKYLPIGEREYHIGYSSYDLSNVLNWLKECFEIITDIPVFGEWHNIKEDGLPKEAGYYLVALRRTKYGDNSVYYDMNYIYFRGKTTWATANGSIKAWMALPKAYEGE